MELANKLELFEKELIAITEKAEQMQQEKELQDKQTEVKIVLKLDNHKKLFCSQ